MKKISRKLLLSILSMAFAVVALGTTTFAWFTTNATVTATTQIKVQSTTDSIQISDDCFSWGSTVNYDLTGTELGAATYQQAGDKLAATDKITSMDDTTVDLGNGSGYKSIVMYLKVTSANKKIEIHSDTVTATGSKPFTTTKNVTFKNMNGDSITLATGSKFSVNAANALRGTLDVTNAVSISADSDLYAAGIDNAETVFGDTKDLTNTRLNVLAGYQSTTTTITTTNPTANTEYNLGQSLAGDNCANAYIEAVLGTNFSDSTNTATYKAANANYVTTNGSVTADGWAGETVVESTTVDSVYRLTFTYWLEGYDADCFDAIFAQTINQTLTFTTTDAA